MRDVADVVRAGGTDALTEADSRADQARYQEVRCKSALNRAYGMPFSWTLNPYRGCTHGCHYCYARKYHKQFEMNADDEFASVILVKTNIVEVLRRELRRPVVDRRAGGDWLRDRLLSADRGPLQADAGCARGAARARQPGQHRHQGSDDRPRQGPAGALVGGGGQHRLRQRAVRRRGRVRGTGAGHGLTAAAPARGARAGRRRRARPDPDEPDCAGVLVEAGAHRTHRRGLCGARGADCRRQRDAPRGGSPDALFRLARARAPGAGAGYRELYRGKSAPAAYTKEVARVLGNARAKADRKGP